MMKYYSDVTKQFYENSEACEAAEKAATVAAAKKKAEEEERALTLSKEKKECAKAVEEASNKIDEIEHRRILLMQEYNDKLTDINRELTEARTNKYKALADFTNKYGAYSVKLTGEAARKELDKAMTNMNNLFSNFWF